MDATGTLAEVLKGEGPRVLATLARTIGDLAVAEDALSEATITALDAWPRTGIPDNPRAWLAVVARRKALDLLRRESARAAKEAAAFRWGTGAAPDQIEEAIEAMEPETSLRDDMLRLIFTCCHPALSREAQVALSLRTLARLEVPAIARAFLVPEATMAKRLVRARAKIATARIPYAIPADTELPGRLAAVLAVVYLIATEAHAPTGGDAVARVDLEAEAIRLARLLASLMPDEPEALSLLALLLLTSARTPARTDADGNPVTLADQDRTRWNRAAIAEGSAWLSEAVTRSGGVAGPYQIQAHLAAAHSTAAQLAGDGLGPDRRPLRLARVDHGQPGGGAQPGGRGYRARRPRGGAGCPEDHRRPGVLPSVARCPGGQPVPARPHERRGRRTSRRGDPGAQRGRTAPPAGPSAQGAVRARLTAFWFSRFPCLAFSPDMSCARFTVRPFPARAVPDLADRPGKEKQMTGSSTKQAGAPGVRSGTQLSSQGGTTMTDETISATTIINAPAEAIFAVLADPAKHAAIDGTGWVREPLDGQPLTAAGQVFRMAMYNDNVPGGHYRMANRVQVFDPPRAISWEPGMDTGDGNPQIVGHIWRYDLAPAGPSGTKTTLSYDWSAVPDSLRQRLPFPFPPFAADHLSNSLAHLAELVTG